MSPPSVPVTEPVGIPATSYLATPTVLLSSTTNGLFQSAASSTSYGGIQPAATSAASSGASIPVAVGAFMDPLSNKTKFEFRPNNVTARVGDFIVFNMLGQSHSVTQSSFDSPCQSLGIFDTGLSPNPLNASNAVLKSFRVYTNEPLWFYCKQKGHCQKGMVFSINPESNAQMESFVNKSKLDQDSGSANMSTALTSTTSATSAVVTVFSTAIGSGTCTASAPSSNACLSAVPGLGWNASTPASGKTPPAPTSPIAGPSMNVSTNIASSIFSVPTGHVSGARRLAAPTLYFLGGCIILCINT
ncbi:MAG: hypothetical protein LQ340_002746 [Diploschistes diacapsis]|nr:MAG: hypothetical protein LQ340_002746 [Diploschistes diacapsis]